MNKRIFCPDTLEWKEVNDEKEDKRPPVIGRYTLADGESYVLTLGAKLYTHNSFIHNADYKTALARGQGCIPPHSEVILMDSICNLYGNYLRVYYNNDIYYVKADMLYYNPEGDLI